MTAAGAVAAPPLRVGLIGVGAVGGAVAAAWAEGRLGLGLELVAALARTARPGARPAVVAELELFLAARPGVVVEAAGHAALREHGAPCLEAGADLLVTSAGALAEGALLDRLLAAAAAAGRKLRVASAGVGGLDALAAASVGGLDRVRVTVVKDPAAWRGTPAERTVDLGALAESATLFQGPVREGAALYPRNVDFAAAAALAGLGFDRTELLIVADPDARDHVVTIEAEGAFGRFTYAGEVRPTAENPKTGRLVAMAVVKSLRQLAGPLAVGG